MSWFNLKRPKIEVFVRHCFYSEASRGKKRYDRFTHEKCYRNLIDTANLDQVGITLLLDTRFASGSFHFIEKERKFPIVRIDAGSEGKSFLALLDYVLEKKYRDETLLYFLEDDYLHRKGWGDILLEGFNSKRGDYLTLYDHLDKYCSKTYPKLQSEIFSTSSCHWRTTPSTTNTYAMSMGTLRRDIALHRAYSEDRSISADHEKFVALGKEGKTLISSIPGWATHAEPEFASPAFDWSCFF